MIKELEYLLNPYYRAGLDCDGQSRVFHYILTENAVLHQLYFGFIEEKKMHVGFDPHMWIAIMTNSGKIIIDYKARKWLGQDERIPHGVFYEKQYPDMYYIGDIIQERPLPLYVIDALLNQ